MPEETQLTHLTRIVEDGFGALEQQDKDLEAVQQDVRHINDVLERILKAVDGDGNRLPMGERFILVDAELKHLTHCHKLHEDKFEKAEKRFWWTIGSLLVVGLTALLNLIATRFATK